MSTPIAEPPTDPRRGRITRRRAGWTLVLIGVAILSVELLRYWLAKVAITPAPVGIGAVLGFVGFYLLDSSSAKDATSFVVTSAVTILGALPFGRRWTDKVATAAAAAAPTAGPSGDAVIIVPGVTTEPGKSDDERDG